MRMSLAPLDLAVVALFVAGILALGFSARLRNNSVLQFIAAGRSLTLPVFVATLVSMWYGGILGVGESVASYGIGTWVLLGVPYYVFAILYAFVFAKRVRGAEEISLPERLELRFGRPVALLGAGLVFLLAVPAAHVLMLGVLVKFVSGWNLTVSVLVGTAVGTAFLYKGGLLADARVSLLAFLMMYIGFAAIVAFCLVHFPLGETFRALRADKPAMFAWDGGQGIPFVVSFLILGSWTLVDPGFHQRVASSASPAIGKTGVLVSVFFWFLFDVMSISTGMFAVAKVAKPEPMLLFPMFGDQVLPSGLKAVFLCGMLGTIVSAMVGYTLVSGATVGREIVARVHGGLDDRAVKAWTRAGFVFACLWAIGLALSIKSVVDLWYAWSGAVVGALLVPVALSYGLLWKSRVSSACVFAATAMSFGASLCWLIYGIRTENPYLNVSIFGWSFSLGTLLPGLVISALVVGAGEAVCRRR